MEEFAELQQQVSKQIRGYNDRIGLLEEMADAYIGLELLKSIFNISEEDMQKAVDVKLERERRKEKTKMKRLNVIEVWYVTSENVVELRTFSENGLTRALSALDICMAIRNYPADAKIKVVTEKEDVDND